MRVQGSDWIRVRLAEQRLSQRQLARLIGLEPSAVSLMFRGKRKMSAEEAAAVSRLLNVDVEELIGHLRDSEPGKAATGHAGGPAGGFAATGGAGEDDGVVLPVPLTGGGMAQLSLPRRLGVADAERIAALVRAFAVE